MSLTELELLREMEGEVQAEGIWTDGLWRCRGFKRGSPFGEGGSLAQHHECRGSGWSDPGGERGDLAEEMPVGESMGC